MYDMICHCELRDTKHITAYGQYNNNQPMPSRLHLCLVQAETNQLTIVTVSTEDGAVKESHATISRSSITNDRGGLVVWCIISSQMFDPILRIILYYMYGIIS